MAVLGDHQKISRILPGKPFGDGSDGDVTISSDPNTRENCTGTIDTTALTLSSAILSNDDIFAIHQSQGSGAGQWEINRVSSGGGTTSITCEKSLKYTYVADAQVIKFSMYDDVTINSFTMSIWSSTKHGIIFVCGRNSISGSGTITGVGGNSTGVGGSSSSSGGTGAGFPGGLATKTPGTVNQGAGTSGGGTTSTSANGNGGGGGSGGTHHGAGGGNGTSGGSSSSATGGGTAGAADLTTMVHGGGGGGGSSNNTSATERSGGGGGGGIVVLISKDINVSSASVNVSGGDSDSNSGGFWDGGGGAGGSALLVCSTATLGTNKVDASAGSGAKGSPNGGVGRIAVHHSGTVTGTTTPTFDDTTDGSLTESQGAFLLNFL